MVCTGVNKLLATLHKCLRSIAASDVMSLCITKQCQFLDQTLGTTLQKQNRMHMESMKESETFEQTLQRKEQDSVTSEALLQSEPFDLTHDNYKVITSIKLEPLI